MSKLKSNDRKNSLRLFFTLHTWWGKIIGAFMGFLIGGPTGALFGLLVGNFFDRGLAQHFSQPYWHFRSEKSKSIQKIFFNATFSVMGHIAKADGRVTSQEIKMASTLMNDMKLNREQQKEARNLFRKGKSPTFDLKKTLTQLREILQFSPELLKLFVDIQYQAASVDGLTQKKMNAINTILLYLGFAPLHKQHRFYEDYDYNPFHFNPSDDTQKWRRSYSSYQNYQRSYRTNSPLEQAFAILEVPLSANKEEVKKAYRRQMSKNHPDKLISKGLPEEMIRLANEKTHKISKAYDQICQSKGW